MASTELIGWFADISLADRPTVGGKGGSLGELTRAGIAVPPGFVVRTAAFEDFIVALERAGPLRARVEALAADDLAGIAACSVAIMARVNEQPLPDALRAALVGAHARTVRRRRAGAARRALLGHHGGCRGRELRRPAGHLLVGDGRRRGASARCDPAGPACIRCPPSPTGASTRLPEAGVAMAVVVQKMVDARTAGVMFTRSPTTGDRSVIVIEGAWGLGSAVVSGEVTPDRFVLGKITGEISVRDIRDKHVRHVPLAAGGTAEEATPAELREAPCVSDAELQQLRRMARRIEQHYGRRAGHRVGLRPAAANCASCRAARRRSGRRGMRRRWPRQRTIRCSM